MKQTRAICINSQKGGVGKTTMTTSLAYALGTLNKKVLIIDFDSQANASTNVGIDVNEEFVCLGHLIEDYATSGYQCNISEIVDCIEQPVYTKNIQEKGQFGYIEKEFKYPFFILPVSFASKAMIRVENCLIPQNNFAHKHSETVAYYMLKPVVEKIKKELDFDFILIDTPPSLNILSLNAMFASDYLVMPCMLNNDSLTGVLAVYDIIREVQLNAPYFINLGIVLQKFSERRNLDRYLKKEIEESEIPIFNSTIPDAFNKINESNARGKLVNISNENLRIAFENVAKELLERIEKEEKKKNG